MLPLMPRCSLIESTDQNLSAKVIGHRVCLAQAGGALACNSLIGRGEGVIKDLHLAAYEDADVASEPNCSFLASCTQIRSVLRQLAAWALER